MIKDCLHGFNGNYTHILSEKNIFENQLVNTFWDKIYLFSICCGIDFETEGV